MWTTIAIVLTGVLIFVFWAKLMIRDSRIAEELQRREALVKWAKEYKRQQNEKHLTGETRNNTLETDVDDLQPRSVEFTPSQLVVTLVDGSQIATPLDWYPRLVKASAAQRSNYEIVAMGIHWPDLDEDLSIAGMLKEQKAH